MKTKEEIEQLAIDIIKTRFNETSGYHKIVYVEAYIKGYTQCQKDMTLQGKCLSGKSYNDCHIHSSNIFGCLSCGNFEKEKL